MGVKLDMLREPNSCVVSIETVALL